MSKPFAGVKILDFTRVLAGPYASYQLALLGADVIKVEALEGDEMRYGTRSNDWEKRGLAATWVSVNGNKRSITMDLKSPRAIEAIKRLVPKVDVVIENFRPGVLKKYGLDKPTATVTLSLASAKASLLLGGKSADGAVYAKDASKTVVMTIDGTQHRTHKFLVDAMLAEPIPWAARI